MENSDWKDLILTVGKYHIRKRSPIEVAYLIQKAIDSGFTRKEIAKRCLLADSTMLGKFLNLLKLPKEYLHLIDWPEKGAPISMTAAQKAGHHDTKNQKIILDARLKYEFSKTDIDFLGQRLITSGNSPEECIQEVINRRKGGAPMLFGIIVGSYNADSKSILSEETQYEKEDILQQFLKIELKKDGIKIKSKADGFTIIAKGEKLFNELSNNIEKIETDINEFICKAKQ